MRKIFYFLSILFCGIILSGCGSKKEAETLSCEMVAGNQTQIVNLIFNEDNTGVSKVTMEVTRTYGEDIQMDEINEAKQSTEDSCNASDFSKCEAKLDGRKLTYYVETDDSTKLGVDKNKSKEETKVIFENDGYICK